MYFVGRKTNGNLGCSERVFEIEKVKSHSGKRCTKPSVKKH